MRRTRKPCSEPPRSVADPPEAGWFPSAWAPYGVDMSGATVVYAGDDLQSALNNARPGHVLALEAGATWRGNFTLPVTEGDGQPILITTTAYERLPPIGTRITPEACSLMPHLIAPNATAALQALPASHHWRIRGLRFSAEVYSNSLFRFGSGYETTEAELPHHFDVSQCWCAGHPDLGAKRGFQINGVYVTIRDCWINDCKAEGQDTQAICGWSVRYLWVENCFLEGAAENFMLIGFTDIPDWVPCDVVLTRNHLYKPLAWKGELKPDGSPKWVIKNLFELKAGRRVHVHGNVLENVWPSGQRGAAFNLKPDTDVKCSVPYTEDVRIEYNVILNAATAFQISGYEPNNAMGAGYCRRVTMRHNAFVDLAPQQCMMLLTMPAVDDIAITDNTMLAPGWTGMQLQLTPPAPPRNMSAGLDFRRNIATFGTGIKADSTAYGTPSLEAAYGDAWKYEQNVLIGAPVTTHPAGNVFDETLEFGDNGYSQDQYALGCDDAVVSAATGGVVVVAGGVPAVRGRRRSRSAAW